MVVMVAEHLEPVLAVIEEHLAVSAAVAALVVSYVLYGVLGRRALGADDDYWPTVRRHLSRWLTRLAEGTPGLYAEGRSVQREYAGLVTLDEEEFEERLEAAAYYRNPLAAYKHSPEGTPSAGSWARRIGGPREFGDHLREHVDVPVLGGTFARFLQGLGDVLAVEQVHLTFYPATDAGGQWCYVHREYNSLNPVVALLHYRGIGLSPARGVDRFVRDCVNYDIPIRDTPDRFKPDVTEGVPRPP